MLSININGHQLEIAKNTSVLEAINASGTYISQLCKDPDMKPIGACRTCLVKIDGVKGYPASCSTPVTDGMTIWTETSDVKKSAYRCSRTDTFNVV